MAIIEKQIPHEFLARWDDAGNLQGAHIAYRVAYVDDTTNAEVTSKFGDPQPVDLTNAALLSQISADINQSALADNATQAAQITQLTADKDAAVQAKADAETARDASLAQVATLQAQLATYQNPVVNGIPQSLHKWQVMIGLGRDGIRDQIVAFIATLSQAAQDLWVESTMVERSSPLFEIAKQRLGWTDSVIDDMFTRYNAITLADITA